MEARLEMWLSQERSWQIVRPRSLDEKEFFQRIVEKVDGGMRGAAEGGGGANGPFGETK